ncbi:MAG TPA: MFS transporter, partial [Acidobacteriota bacterium]|nr:MFS transporter [Acidobacteriota bacterium]
LYPTPMRATGAGTAAAVGRTGGILAPLVVGSLLQFGQPVVFAQFATVVLLGAVAVAFLGEETKQRSLEQI